MAKPRTRTQKQYLSAIARDLADILGGEGWDDPRVMRELQAKVDPPADHNQRELISMVIEQMLNDSYDPRDHLDDDDIPARQQGSVRVLVTFTDLRSRKEFHRIEEKYGSETWQQFELRMRRFGFDFPFKLTDIWDDKSVEKALAEVRRREGR